MKRRGTKEEVSIIGKIAYVVVTNRRGEEFVVKLDVEDLPIWKAHIWTVTECSEGRYYVNRTIETPKGRTVEYLHRALQGAKKGQMVDHVNQDSLDNRKGNLRFATPSQNGVNAKRSKVNTSGEPGVNWHPTAKKWRAYLRYQGKQLHLGLFDLFPDAVRARREAEDEFFGHFAPNLRRAA